MDSGSVNTIDNEMLILYAQTMKAIQAFEKELHRAVALRRFVNSRSSSAPPTLKRIANEVKSEMNSMKGGEKTLGRLMHEVFPKNKKTGEFWENTITMFAVRNHLAHDFFSENKLSKRSEVRRLKKYLLHHINIFTELAEITHQRDRSMMEIVGTPQNQIKKLFVNHLLGTD